MTDIFNFDDTSDVTDEALEFLLGKTESGYTVDAVRRLANTSLLIGRAFIIAARLIQKHEPDLIVDPVTKRVREIEAEHWWRSGRDTLSEKVLAGEFDDCTHHAIAKAAYLAGMKDAGK